MATMIRKQIYIFPEQEMLLSKFSRERKTPESVLIREGIDHALRKTQILSANPAAWEQEKTFIRTLAKKGKVKGKRSWTRDSLYE